MSPSRRRWRASRPKKTDRSAALPFDRYAAEARPALEEALGASLPPDDPQAPGLSGAIRDAVLSPGKRLRPLVALAAGRLARSPLAAATAVAVAVEYLHAASLVLDDLPSMDDARRRRGRPALHVTYGVATAELASVALVARAFEVVAGAPAMPAASRARAAGELARAVGAAGCCAGQAADLAADPSALTLEDLEAIHARKTGALFVAAVRGGAIAGAAREAQLEALTLYARNLGLAFQITDDLLDVEGDPERMGKDARRDAHRANFATLFGTASSRRLVEELLEAAVSALGPFGAKGEVLADLARVVRTRRA
ncbi:MAG TPA: polyprenyl synthetase family protein [Thermoanaerobaculia bacterium]|nr:polyprenyl synthetase family protein [Thermoanaerobaculia bacterium]